MTLRCLRNKLIYAHLFSTLFTSNIWLRLICWAHKQIFYWKRGHIQIIVILLANYESDGVIRLFWSECIVKLDNVVLSVDVVMWLFEGFLYNLCVVSLKITLVQFGWRTATVRDRDVRIKYLIPRCTVKRVLGKILFSAFLMFFLFGRCVVWWFRYGQFTEMPAKKI